MIFLKLFNYFGQSILVLKKSYNLFRDRFGGNAPKGGGVKKFKIGHIRGKMDTFHDFVTPKVPQNFFGNFSKICQ